MTRETVTLQFGDFSNLSTVHYWNSLATQLRLSRWANETVFDFDVFFRDQAQLSPRTVVFERPREHRRIEDVGAISPEPLNAELIVLTKLGGFQGELKSWHDVSFVNVHRKALCPLPDTFQTDTADPASWLAYAPSTDLEAAAEDCLRFLIEECDQLAEFRIMADAASMHGSLARCVVEGLLVDEYPKTFVRTWANFASCQDFRFTEQQPSIPLKSLALAKLSQVSHELFPVLLAGPKPVKHLMFEEELQLDRVLDASVVVGAAIDTWSTTLLSRNVPLFSGSVLTDPKLATPQHNLAAPHFTSISTLVVSPQPSWEQSNLVQRQNHTDQTYPSTVTPADLPIYAPNFVFTGYQQQATSAFLINDKASRSLSDTLKKDFVKALRRPDFAYLEDADLFTQVKEDLLSLTMDDE